MRALAGLGRMTGVVVMAAGRSDAGGQIRSVFQVVTWCQEVGLWWGLQRDDGRVMPMRTGRHLPRLPHVDQHALSR